MSKRSRREKARRAQAHRQRPARSGRRPARSGPAQGRREPDLMEDVAAALAAGTPLPLLGLASSMLAMFEPRPSFAAPAEPAPPDREEVIDSFFAVEIPETSALLAALAGLSGDDVLRHRVRREIAARGHALPRWLLDLDQAQSASTVIEMRHVLGDGDDIVLGLRLPGGHQLAAAVFIDHNLGTLVKDAFLVPGGAAELVDVMRASTDDPDVTFAGLDPADARARIAEAMELSALTYPPIETDSWPACRPLLEWAIGLLPDGGTGYVRPEWPDDARTALAERFLRSPFGAGFDDADHRGLLEDLVWFGADYGPGDPLRWSPVAVEILLADWIPRKIVADVDYLAKAPDLLRAFIRFSHAERGIRAALTDETLAAVDEFEPEYQAVIRRPRPQGPMALLARMGAVDPDGPWPAPGEATWEDDELAELADAVGGVAALDALDDTPLPDEAFDWDLVPDDVRPRVGAVLDLVDRCCDELMDVELRTAARRLLARVAAAEPELFLRRSRPEGTAAGVCWIVATANHLFRSRRLAVKQLTSCIGLTGSPASHAKALLQAIGVDPDGYAYGDGHLGSPDYLTGAYRAGMVADRDRLRA